MRCIKYSILNRIFFPTYTTTETIKLPEKITDEMIENVEFLKVLHHVLLEIVVVEGQLICPESGRIFPISQGIPNMLLNEDEV